MAVSITKEKAWEAVKKYNQDKFHLQHALTVAAVMKRFAEQQGEDAEYWEIVGMLHDVDFELYPEQHCQKAPEMLREAGVPDDVIRAVCSHGYGQCSDIKPERIMEKILFATDELTGLIGAAALMRPSKSVQDMELKSLKKKFKDKSFAAGCSRDVIRQGAEMLGWELDELLSKTLDAMRDCETELNEEIAAL